MLKIHKITQTIESLIDLIANIIDNSINNALIDIDKIEEKVTKLSQLIIGFNLKIDSLKESIEKARVLNKKLRGLFDESK